MADEYLIPFGLDTATFFEGVQAIDKGIDAMDANVQNATKEMQKGFNDAAAAGDNLGKTITVDAEKAAKLRDEAKTLGKELGDALSGKGVSSEMEKKLTKFNDLLVKFASNAAKPIKFNFDDAKLAAFDKALQDGAGDIEILTQAVGLAKDALGQLDPNSQEFAELNTQIEIAATFLAELGAATDNVTKKNLSLKGELKQIKAALAEMELAGKEGTAEFEAMAIRGGQLEDQIGDISNRIRVLASDTKYLDAGIQAVQGLAGAFTAGQGALALFGSESEEANRVIQKVTGAMAVLQGIQAIANALNKDSALSVLLFSRAQATAAVSTEALAGAEVVQTAATVGAATAMRAFTAALLANPITAILVGLTAIITALIAFSDNSAEAEKATKALNEALEAQKLLLDLDEASMKRRTDLMVAQAKAAGKSESEITQIEGEAIARRINRRQEAYAEFVKLYNDSDKRALLSAEDNKKLEDELLKRQAQNADDLNELEIKRIEKQGDLRKEDEAAKKKADEAEKKRLEDAKKAAEERKKILEQQIKFTRELEAARVDAIADQYERERAQARANTAAKIADLEAEKALSGKAEKDRNALIKQLRANLGKEIKTIDDKQAADQAALQFKAAQTIIDNREEGIVKEVETIRLGYEEKKQQIKEEFKNETDLRQQLLDQLNDAQIRDTKKAQSEFTNKSIALQEERAVLEVETAAKYVKDLPGIEEQKQVAVLEVKIKYAKLALQALLDQGNAENSTVVLQAKKTVQELEKALKTAVNEAKPDGINWFKMLGLGELSQEQRDAVIGAAQQALSSISEITGFIVDQYQRQIDKKQEVIDQIDNDIDDLEDKLDKEKQLRDDGFANNVELLEAELAEKKKAKDEEIKQAEELQKRQAAIQRAQLILDTVTQASNLITSATQIFKALSGIPFIGVPLAIATIGLMTGAFVAAKVKAFQLVNDQKQQFGGGGWIDGKPHSEGGKKYVAADGSGDVVELEAGEHVTKKAQAAKYGTLLEAINNNNIAGMNDEALRDMLAGMGIHLQSDSPKEVLTVARERDSLKAQVMLVSGGPDISNDVTAINQNVKYLADKERDKTERWEDDKHYYIRKGQKTTKIRKA